MLRNIESLEKMSNIGCLCIEKNNLTDPDRMKVKDWHLFGVYDGHGNIYL